MYIILSLEDFRKLVPDITNFEFHKTLKKVGLKYIYMERRQLLIKDKVYIPRDRYEYQLEVIDKQVFLLNTIKCGIQPEIIVDGTVRIRPY
jgi:hypothetical protein